MILLRSVLTCKVTILDSSLDDIKYVLNPTFTEPHIKNLDSSTKLSRAIDGSLYMPGIVGLNNIKANDYCNVVLQVSNSLNMSYRSLKIVILESLTRCSFT